MPTRDCDVCIIGDDAAGLLIACDLAERGLDVVLFPSPGEAPALGLDAALAPGFGLSALDLIDQLGRADAGELFGLSAAAARRGLLLAQEGGVALGPKGRLTVARPHAAGLLAAEHEALERLAPDASVLLRAEDTEALLGTAAFAASLGVVPAHRVDAAAFREMLAAAVAAGGITVMPQVLALAADVHGLRKYVTTPDIKVRAYQVVFSGGAALRRVAPELAPSFVLKPWARGRFRLPGTKAAYAGLVEEVGATGLRWHWDDDHLTIAAETATRVRGRAAAARVLRRHGAAVFPPLAKAGGEAARGIMLASNRRLMPLIQEGEKGVWYCATACGDELTHGLLGAELIGRAITDRDDRIRLLRHFGLEPAGTRPVSRLASIAGYWRRRFAERLWIEPEPSGPAPESHDGSAPAAPLPPSRAPHPARRGALAAVALSRRAARVAARLAFGPAGRPSAD